MVNKAIEFLFNWAWCFLGLGLLFDAFSTQLFYNVHSMEGASMLTKIAFAIGGMLGDIPSIVATGVVLSAIILAVKRKFSLRIFILSAGIGCFLNALVIHPILIEFYRAKF